MAEFRVGELVKLPCEIVPGAFPDERLVGIETGDGPISGFVKENLLESEGGNRGYITGKVIAVANDYVTVQLPGSFFTTAAGKASVPRGWADSKLVHVAA